MVDLPTILQNEYLNAAIVLVAFIVIAKIGIWISKTYLRKLTEKTQTDLDDQIISTCETPLFSLCVLFGVYLSARTLTILAPYGETITNILFVLAVIVITILVARLITILTAFFLKVGKQFEKTPRLISKVVNVIVYIAAGIIILDYFGVAVSPILATLGVGGLAVGLALQPTLADLFSGVHIISDKPLRVGDFIEIDAETKGTVEDIGWRSTRIKAPGNKIIIIPNSKLATSTIFNISMPELEVSCVVYCGVGYGEDLEKVEKIVLDLAKRVIKKTKGAVKDYKPLVRFHEFGDSNINFKVILRAETRGDKFFLTHEFIKALKKEFDKKKIDISYPIMKVLEQ